MSKKYRLVEVIYIFTGNMVWKLLSNERWKLLNNMKKKYFGVAEKSLKDFTTTYNHEDREIDMSKEYGEIKWPTLFAK